MGLGLNFLLNDVTRQREQWLSSRTPEKTRETYIDAIGEFTKELKIVTGEANGKLFEKEGFAEAIERVFHQNPNAIFRLVFHKRDTEVQACKDFEEENSSLFDLKRRYPENVSIYWTPNRPRQHYAVIDNRAVILEQPHHTSLQPFWATIVHDDKISTLWEERFDTYVSHLNEAF